MSRRWRSGTVPKTDSSNLLGKLSFSALSHSDDEDDHSSPSKPADANIPAPLPVPVPETVDKGEESDTEDVEITPAKPKITHSHPPSPLSQSSHTRAGVLSHLKAGADAIEKMLDDVPPSDPAKKSSKKASDYAKSTIKFGTRPLEAIRRHANREKELSTPDGTRSLGSTPPKEQTVFHQDLSSIHSFDDLAKIELDTSVNNSVPPPNRGVVSMSAIEDPSPSPPPPTEVRQRKPPPVQAAQASEKRKSKRKKQKISPFWKTLIRISGLIQEHWKVLLMMGIVLFSAGFLPFPVGLRWFLFGSFFGAGLCMWLCLQFVFVPKDEIGLASEWCPSTIAGAEHLKNARNLNEPWRDQRVLTESVNCEPSFAISKGWKGIHEGWMHELHAYDPETYHINKTTSVFIKIDGTQMTLRRPKERVPKRALWSEPPVYKVSWLNTRTYELMGSLVMLQPPGLKKKQVWNKKYPLCIRLTCLLSSEDLSQTKSVETASEATESNSDLAPANNIPEESDFEVVDRNESITQFLYLFARSDHEKEAWFRRFDAASKGVSSQEQCFKQVVDKKEWRDEASGFTNFEELTAGSEVRDSSPTETRHLSSEEAQLAKVREFAFYMEPFVPASLAEGPCDSHMLSVNALLRRLFYDFFREEKWEELMSAMIQRMVNRIKRPHFIEELTIRKLKMGKALPVIQEMGVPIVDQSGLWVNMEIAYAPSVGCSVTIGTRVNLHRLRRARSVEDKSLAPEASELSSPPTTSSSMEFFDTASFSTNNATTDDSEDANLHLLSSVVAPVPAGAGVELSDDGATSGESTTESELEEEASELVEKGNNVGGAKTRKVLSFMDRFAQTKLAKKIADFKVINKGINFVAKQDIVLDTSVESLRGKLVVNIRPPPSDRIWVGFRDSPFPELKLRIKPSFGQRVLSVRLISDWINKKFMEEFQRKIVLPNMVDLPVPLLSSDHPERVGHSDLETSVGSVDTTPTIFSSKKL